MRLYNIPMYTNKCKNAVHPTNYKTRILSHLVAGESKAGSQSTFTVISFLSLNRITVPSLQF